MLSLFVFYKNVLVFESNDLFKIKKSKNYLEDKEILCKFFKKNQNINKNLIINRKNKKFIIYSPIFNYKVAIYGNKNIKEELIYDDFENIFLSYKENDDIKLKNYLSQYKIKETNIILNSENINNNFFFNKNKIKFRLLLIIFILFIFLTDLLFLSLKINN